MSETTPDSVILCEGAFDRSFWAGLLSHLGCNPVYQRQPNGPRFVRGFQNVAGHEIVADVTNSRSSTLRALDNRLNGLDTEPLVWIVVNVDADTDAGDAGAQRLTLNDIAQRVERVRKAAPQRDGDTLQLSEGTRIGLIRWETKDFPTPELPDKQTLERLICAAVCDAYPERGESVRTFLASRSLPPKPDPKEFAWTHMAGWYATHGCQNFYAELWRDPGVTAALENRLQASGAWSVIEGLVRD